MKRIDFDIKKTLDKTVFSVNEDTHYVLKAIGEIANSYEMVFIPTKNGVKIDVTVLSFLKGSSDLNLIISFKQEKGVANFQYLLNGNVVLTDNSRAAIHPNITTMDNKSTANHMLTIGGINRETREYLNSKGLEDEAISSFFKQTMEEY